MGSFFYALNKANPLLWKGQGEAREAILQLHNTILM